MTFRPKTQHELAQLQEEDLLAYLVGARRAGDREAMAVGVYVLVASRLPFIEAMVARKTPPELRPDLVNDIFGDIVEAATRGEAGEQGFQGEHLGEFVNFIKTIAHRRIVDALQKQSRRLRTRSLDQDDEDSYLPEPEGGVNDPEGSAMLRDAIGRVLASRSEVQRRIITLRYTGVPSKQVVARIPDQTVANVDQLFSRFRRDLKRELDGQR